MFGGLWAIGGCLKPTIYNTAILVIVGGCIYIGLLLVLRDAFFMDNARKVLLKIKRN